MPKNRHQNWDDSVESPRRHRKTNDPVAAAWAGALAAFVLGKILKIALLFLRFFLRARLRSADAAGLVSFVLRCLLKRPRASSSPTRVRSSPALRALRFSGALAAAWSKALTFTAVAPRGSVLSSLRPACRPGSRDRYSGRRLYIPGVVPWARCNWGRAPD